MYSPVTLIIGSGILQNTEFYTIYTKNILTLASNL